MESMFQECLYVGADSCLPVHYEQLILHPEQTTRKIFSFLNITWNEAVLHHEKYIGDEITLSKVERSSDQVIKPINLQALTAWVGQIPDDVLNQMDLIAPMLRRLGYDPFANPPKYGEPDAIIEENTNNVIKNKEFWKKQILKVMNGY
jgi:protein-tyrosine sulfotransferase